MAKRLSAALQLWMGIVHFLAARSKARKYSLSSASWLELYKPTMARRMPRKSTLAWLLGYEPSESSPTSY